MAATSSHRWHELLDNITGLLPAGTAAVATDGPGEQREAVAGGLAAALRTAGRPCLGAASGEPDAAVPGTVPLADGPTWRTAREWDVVIWVRAGLRPPDGSRFGSQRSWGEFT